MIQKSNQALLPSLTPPPSKICALLCECGMEASLVMWDKVPQAPARNNSERDRIGA